MLAAIPFIGFFCVFLRFPVLFFENPPFAIFHPTILCGVLVSLAIIAIVVYDQRTASSGRFSIRCVAAGVAVFAGATSYYIRILTGGWLIIPLLIPYAAIVVFHVSVVLGTALRIERPRDFGLSLASSLLLFVAFAFQVDYGDTTGWITIWRYLDPSTQYIPPFLRRSDLTTNVLWFVLPLLAWIAIIALARRRARSSTKNEQIVC
jgi:hypothetical protein